MADLHVPAGVYRNRTGDELVITGPWVPNGFFPRHGTLGGIYEARAVSGRHRTESYLVTRASLEATGYKPLSTVGGPPGDAAPG
ncbi:hypothetical protein LG293_16110 (plasmid) [Citricoccus nitrophenolicus]